MPDRRPVPRDRPRRVTAGFDASSGLRSSIVSGLVARASRQPSAAFVQPAALSAALRPHRSKGPASAGGSNSGDVGGIGEFADPAPSREASSMMPAGRSRRERRADRGSRTRVAGTEVEEDRGQRRARVAQQPLPAPFSRASSHPGRREPGRGVEAPARGTPPSASGIVVEAELDARQIRHRARRARRRRGRQRVGAAAVCRGRRGRGHHAARAGSSCGVVGQAGERERAGADRLATRTDGPPARSTGTPRAGGPGRSAGSSPGGTRQRRRRA